MNIGKNLNISRSKGRRKKTFEIIKFLYLSVPEVKLIDTKNTTNKQKERERERNK